MVRRWLIIIFGFFCVLAVLIIGSFIYENMSDVEGKENYSFAKVFEEYRLWKGKDKTNIEEHDNLMVLIEIDKKMLYLIDKDTNKILKKYIVATGKYSTPTPIGDFKVIQKAMWGEGFGTRWIGLNVPWGKYGIHGTDKPNSIGWNSSHGCIRMRNKDIEELYRLVKYNTPVTLEGGALGPFTYGLRVLMPGHRGSDVQEVQRILKEKGYYHGSLDGIYGNGMKVAIMKFQKDNNLPVTNRIGHTVYKKLGIVLME